MSKLLKQMQNADSFSDSEIIISKYLIENYRDIANLSARELAKRTFTSSASLIRFCQKLGFEGYTDFKIKFLTEMMKHGGEIQAEFICEQDNVNAVIDKVRGLQINALNESYDRLNPALMMRVLKLFNSANYIDFYAADRFLNFAGEVSEIFTLANKYSTVHNSMTMQYLQAYKTPKNHLGFFISPMGENRILIDIAKLLKRQSVPTILITSAPKSQLAEIVNENFVVPSGDSVDDLGTSLFLTGAKFVTDTLLAVLIAQTNYKGATDKKLWIKNSFHY